MASPRSHPQHTRSLSNNRFAGMIPPLMLVNPSDLQMNGVRVDGSLLSSKTFIDSMTASFSNQHENISPSTPEFIDSPSSTVSADSFMPPTPQQMHQGRFMCPEPTCSYSIIGLNSGAELDQHVSSGNHIGHPVDFEMDLNNEDQVAFGESPSMLPSSMWDNKNGEYFALPMQPKGKGAQGHCSCRYCNPHENTQESEIPAHQSLELPPAVGGNGFDHRTWQQNMKLEKAMQAVLQQHQRVREAEVLQQNINFANTAQPFGNFYGAHAMETYPVYGNAYVY